MKKYPPCKTDAGQRKRSLRFGAGAAQAAAPGLCAHTQVPHAAAGRSQRERSETQEMVPSVSFAGSAGRASVPRCCL